MGDSLATALVVAAGSGDRLGAARPKAMVEIAGRPMYEWSLRAFASSRTVGRAIVAVPSGSIDQVTERLGRTGSVVDGGQAVDPAQGQAGDGRAAGTGETEVVGGGAARSESVLAALARSSSEIVVVHDAARPLVSPDLIDAVVARLSAEPLDCGGVIAAAPITDTVKRAAAPTSEGGAPAVTETVDRANLWAVQTPQAFRAATLRLALDSVADLALATDDAMLVERLGRRVLIHPSSPRNLKVTTPGDLALAEHLLGDHLG